MSSASSSTSSSGGGFSVFAWLLGLLGSGLGLFLMVVLLTAFFGAVGAEEFSPDSFSRRTYVHYQIPLVGLQVTPTTILTSASDLESYLATQQLIPASATTTPRWDLVQDHSSLSGEPLGAAAVLTTYLDIDREGRTQWLQWSEDHPAHAKRFWPTIAELARAGWYHALPEFFNFAWGERDAATFRRELDQLLADTYFAEGELARQLGQSAEAQRCYRRCLELVPQHSGAQQQSRQLEAGKPGG